MQGSYLGAGGRKMINESNMLKHCLLVYHLSVEKGKRKNKISEKKWNRGKTPVAVRRRYSFY